MLATVRHTLAIVVILCLDSIRDQRAVAQVHEGAASTLVPTATSRNAGESPKQNYDAARGQALYIANCSACHAINGAGQPGTYPPIKGSGVVIKDDATKHIQVVLNGLQGSKAGGVLYATVMPAFGRILDDAEIADIIDFERSSWGNHGKLVSAAQVAAQRAHSN